MNTCCLSLQVDCKVKVQHGSSKISGGYTDLLRHDGKLYVSLYRSFSLYSFLFCLFWSWQTCWRCWLYRKQRNNFMYYYNYVFPFCWIGDWQQRLKYGIWRCKQWKYELIHVRVWKLDQKVSSIFFQKNLIKYMHTCMKLRTDVGLWGHFSNIHLSADLP